MAKDAPQLDVKIRFKDDINEEVEQALWSQLFDILGIYEDEPETIRSMDNNQ